jgi:glutamate-ammonia-ligase adenylyltransferase
MISSHAIPLPVLLSDLANKQWQRLLERANAEQQSLFLSHQPMLLRLLALSDFVAEAVISTPAMLADMLTSERYLQAERSADYPQQLHTALQAADSEESLKRVLRQFRRHPL